jgi:outer membrane protein assembly factor BamB
VVWEYKTNRDGPQASFHGDPLVVDELFLIGTDGPNDDGIYALDWATGALRWMAPAPSRDFGSRGVATDIQLLDGRVYDTSLADELMCVSVADGSLIWSQQSSFRERERILNGTPAIAQAAVFFGGLDGTAYAMRHEDGKRLWATPLGESIRTSVCILENGIVMGTGDGKLHLLDAETGSVKRQLDLGKEPSAAIVEAGGMLLVCTDWIRRSSELMCVDSSLSRVAWTLESPEGTSWSTPRPYVYGEHVFLGNTRGGVFEYRIADGQLVRSTRVEGVIRGIRLVDDVLYVGNQDGTVYAIRR